MHTGRIVYCFHVALLSAAAPVAYAQDQQQEHSPCLHLHTEYLPYFSDQEVGYQDRMERELVRQSFLVAAHEDFGLTVRDGTLREAAPVNGIDTIDIALLVRADREKNTINVRMHRLAAGQDVVGLWQKPTEWQSQFQYDEYSERLYLDLSTTLDANATHELIEKLPFLTRTQRAGVKSSPIEYPLDWRTKVYRLDYVSQLALAREIHNTIDRQGPSADLFGELVRCYANLSMLTQHHASSASTAFAARAMIYMARTNRVYDSSNQTRFDQLCAWSVIGVHTVALELLEQVDAHPESGLSKIDRDFHAIVDRFLHWDQESIEALAATNELTGPWAYRLAFEIAKCYRLPRWTHRAGVSVIERAPTAYDVFGQMAQRGGNLTTTRLGAFGGAVMFATHLFESLRQISALPAGMLDGLDPPSPDAADPFSTLPATIARRLRDASTDLVPGMLSWSALSSLIEEEQFIQGANYLLVAQNAVEASHDEVVDAILNNVADHRYSNYIRSFQSSLSQQQRDELLADIELRDIRGSMLQIWHSVYAAFKTIKPDSSTSPESGPRYEMTLHSLFDDSILGDPDFVRSTGENRKMLAKILAVVVPHCELNLRFEIQFVNNLDQSQLLELEKQIDRDPSAYFFLGLGFEHLDSETDREANRQHAIRCYTKANDLYPDASGARTLANIHKENGDFEKWERALAAFLEQESLGLSRAQVANELALGLVHRGEWRKAKPYSLIAAQSYSAWGLETASIVAEGLGELKESEAWIMAATTNYPSTMGQKWFLWCKRNGRGDVHNAQLLAEHFYGSNPEPTSYKKVLEHGGFYLLVDRKDKALETYRNQLLKETKWVALLMFCLLHPEAEREDAVKAYLKAFISPFKDHYEYQGIAERVMTDTFVLLENDELSAEAAKQLDDKIEDVGVAKHEKISLRYLIGRQLELQGHPSEARDYYRRAKSGFVEEPVFATLAGARLAQLRDTERNEDEVTVNEN